MIIIIIEKKVLLVILMKNKLKIMSLEKTIFKMYFLGSNFENAFWMLDQPVNNKDCSNIQFILREFYQE